MSHAYASLNFHLVFRIKDGSPPLTADDRAGLFRYMAGILKNRAGCLLAAGGAEDHVHLLVSLHPQSAPAAILRDLKAVSSKWRHESRSARKEFGWQTGYGAFTVSRSNLEQVKKYLARQEAHHRKVSFREELRAFLDAHGVDYDPRYL